MHIFHEISLFHLLVAPFGIREDEEVMEVLPLKEDTQVLDNPTVLIEYIMMISYFCHEEQYHRLPNPLFCIG